MGGLVPLGYDLKDRKLVPNPKEAERVAKIFSFYLELGCVRKLVRSTTLTLALSALSRR